MTFFNLQEVLTAGNWRRFNINNLLFALSEQQINFFKSIFQKNNIHSVLDVCCGNGDFAVLLSKWGKKVTVLEPDPLKIIDLRSKFMQDGVILDICAGEMRDISRVYRTQCDLIACLKNSLSGLLSEEDLWGTLAQMYLKLKPGGILIIHTLNYDRILNEDSSQVTVFREYYQGSRIELLFTNKEGGERASLIFKTDLLTGQKDEVIIPVRPILKKELNLWLAELGFEKIKNYDSFDCKTNNADGYHRITAAYRPGTSDKVVNAC